MDAPGQFVAPGWREIFAANGLSKFDDFWDWKVALFEQPNTDRGGWSGVARCELRLPNGGTIRVFLKRQENHVTRTLLHPVRGIPTFAREFQNIMRYRAHAIPSVTPLYFASRQEDGKQRAILLTEELAGFRSLDEWHRDWQQIPPSPRLRRAVIRSVADLLRQIHAHGLRHNCFYPKHIFVRLDSAERVESRAIDLEKTKHSPFRHWRMNDLGTLNRHAAGWSRADRVRFFKEYLSIPHLTEDAKMQWRHLARRLARKHPDKHHAVI
ncbi:MAG TPA: lipopolysaccharide kinase InaA family protein [Candidatus Limnocylindria bacterium]|nr:lipopolysaccharide kinase InaA family protein [Candidatus Limnocylindria bacterium]